ncbi:hypothetical protein [Andreprevotia sp. IGB-42]|uniref:hypothetical protein n=1 Tax=Andreprevotia sp. IGB-42 TaxID=2497473 RepID=UPI00135A7C47|nr:hypothetical protein [Andreprevotia sp. IGB-42]
MSAQTANARLARGLFAVADFCGWLGCFLGGFVLVCVVLILPFSAPVKAALPAMHFDLTSMLIRSGVCLLGMLLCWLITRRSAIACVLLCTGVLVLFPLWVALPVCTVLLLPYALVVLTMPCPHARVAEYAAD